MAEPSYWQSTASLAIAPVEELPAAVDVLVLGAGLLGVATAYFLARAGADVLVVERDTVGAGATARNAGLIVSGTAEAYPVAVARYGRATTRAVWQFTLDNRKLLQKVIAEEAIVCDYHESGYLGLACSEDEWQLAQATVRLLHEDGIVAEVLDRQALQAMVGARLAPRVLGARFAPGEAQIHSARFLYGLARAAQRHGARFALGHAACALSRSGDAWQIDTTRGANAQQVVARHVVCATNAWLPNLLPELGDAITPVRGQVLCTAPVEPIFPCGMSADDGHQYWRQLPDGRIILGGCRLAVADCEIGLTEPATRPEVQRALDDYLPSLFAGLPSLHVEQRWGGIMAFSRDALPLIGPAPQQAGLFVAGGFTGHGMPFGLHAGELLAQACTTGCSPDALAPFSLDRPTLRL